MESEVNNFAIGPATGPAAECGTGPERVLTDAEALESQAWLGYGLPLGTIRICAWHDGGEPGRRLTRWAVESGHGWTHGMCEACAGRMTRDLELLGEISVEQKPGCGPQEKVQK